MCNVIWIQLFTTMFAVVFYSDLKIRVGELNLCAHKFVLAARSDAWSLANLASTSELDLSGTKACSPSAQWGTDS